MEQFVVRQHERPIFGVVVHVNDGKGETLQLCGALTAGDIDEMEIHRVRVHGFAGDQARPVAGLAVVN